MTTNTVVPKTFLLLTQSLCVSTVLICSHSNYLGSFGQLICAGGSIHIYSNPWGKNVAECTLSTGACATRNVSASVIDNTRTVLNISRVETTDAGEWSCNAGLHGVDKCLLTVVKTPTCNITSKEDTCVLVQYQELTLTVDVRDYYCSTSHNVSLQTGNVTTLLMEADSVPSVSDNTSSVTLNVTDSHLGKVGLVFRCGSSQWNLTCDGLTDLETPTCNITSKENTDALVQYQELTLTVDVRDYYCSTSHNVSLQTGNVTTLLMEADTVPSVADNTSSVTLNVTDSHLGKAGLVFRFDSSQWRLTCDGLTDLVPKTTTCDITSDKDTETLTLHEEVRLTVTITAYYNIRGSYCSVDSNFTLQTGDVTHLLNVGDQGLQPVTFNVTQTHLGGVRLVFNCQDKHWNLSCDGVTELNNKMKARDEVATVSIPIIIVAVAVSLVLIVVVVVIIVFVVKRKVNRIKPRSSVKPCSPPYITVGEPVSAAYATVEVNNSIPPASGPGGSQKVVVIDAGGYACAGDIVTNAENISRAPPRDESDELSATSADRPKKEIGVIVHTLVPQDVQTCVNELYASVKKPKDTTLESDTTAV